MLRFVFELHARIFHQLLTFINSRTKESKLLGRPLVILPKPREDLMSIAYTAHERIIYNGVEARFERLRKQKLPDGHRLRTFQNKLHQLTRLRQLVFPYSF
jgi:hypothetical protein